MRRGRGGQAPPEKEVMPLDPRRRELAARYVPLAFRTARRRGPDPDAELSAALWALVEGAAKYDPARGAFSTLAFRLTAWRTRDARRAAGPDPRRLPLDEVPEPSLVGREPDPAAASAAAEAFEALLKPLRARERQLLRLVYRDGHDLRSAGRALGVVKSRASTIHSGALARLRARLA